MKGLVAAIQVEILKARRSKVPVLTAAGITLAPVMGGLFMFLLKDPARARRLGILKAKAQLTAGTADWPSYLGLLAQTVAVGGLLLFAIVTAWLFGREFVDRTARNWLATPTSRRTIVSAKLIVAAIWCAVLAGWALILGLAIGALVGLPGFAATSVIEGLSTFVLAAAMTIALQSTTALVASAGRGYLPALAWAILTLFLAQILAATGWGAFFPWSVPALASGMAGARTGAVDPASVVIVLLTVLAGVGGVMTWWQKADHSV